MKPTVRWDLVAEGLNHEWTDVGGMRMHARVDLVGRRGRRHAEARGRGRRSAQPGGALRRPADGQPQRGFGMRVA